MSKIRQAVRYERRAAKAQDAAHRQMALTEHLAAKELLQQADAFERRFTDGQFGQLSLVAQEHRLFHEREHLLYEDAIEKASTALSVQLAALQTEFDRMREDSHSWLPVGRFEREHKQLIEKMEQAIGNVEQKLDVEERVTTRQQAQEELVARIAQNNRWLIGILITVAIFGLTTVLHVFDII
jgi:hypothetical protein